MGEKNKCLNGIWELYLAQNCECKRIADSIFCENDLKKAGFMHIKATVPGNFELDLVRAGKEPQPFFGTNPLEFQKYENYHLWYVCHFEAGEFNPDFSMIKFGGIDTVADIFLNGNKIGHADNMLIPYEFSAFCLKEENELLVHIEPPFLESRRNKFAADVNYYQPYAEESLTVRRAAHTYGWDIMPRFVSAGLWRDVNLIQLNPDNIEEIYLYTESISENSAKLCGYYSLNLQGDFAKEYSLQISGSCGDSCFCWETERLWHTQGLIEIDVSSPLLWWPRDAGAQNLYSIKVLLKHHNSIVAAKEFDFGIRKIKCEIADIIKEQAEGQFCIYVNDIPVYIRGTNWVPLDAFHSQDVKRQAKALELLYEINCNMVRCWGGNVYPDDEFYSFCDKKGILVWQDFCFACASYPQNNGFAKKVANEAEIIVKQLRLHPSLAIWAGDNECDIATGYWPAVKRNSNDNIINRSVLPGVLKLFDPNRPYLPSSPFVSKEVYENSIERYMPELHIWGSRINFKNDAFLKTKAFFVSEIGYHSCPHPDSVREFISEDKVWHWKDNDEWLVHSSSMQLGEGPYKYRIALMQKEISEIFGEEPDNLERFSMLSQYCQAEALKFFIETFRIGKPRRTGLVWWNLLDGWPQFSDAVVDYYFRKKKSFDFIKRSQEPLCLMLSEPHNGELALYAANDFLCDKSFNYIIKSLSDDKVIKSGNATVLSNSSAVIDKITVYQNTEMFLIEWSCDGKEYKNHYMLGQFPYNFDGYFTLLEKAGLV